MKTKYLSCLLTVLVSLMLFSGCVQETMKKEITFRVDMRNVDSIAAVGIRGDMPPFSWNTSLPLQDKDGDGIYEAEFELRTGQPGLDFKCTLNGEVFELEGRPNRNLPFRYQPERLRVSLVFDQPGLEVERLP